MQIIACEDKTDLRTIVSKSRFLKQIARHYKLKSNQAVCFTNKAMTRFRLVFRISKAIFLCIPEIDEQSKHSVYLKISEELAMLAGISPRLKFEFFKSTAKRRILDQRRRTYKHAKR